MKKKVLYGAALALFASVSMGTLQSCKDDLSDFQHQEAYNNKVLQGQIDDLRKDLTACQSNCATEIANLKLNIADLQKQINDNKADADATKVLAQRLETELKTLSDKVALMYTNDQIDKKLTDLETLLKKYTDDETDKKTAAVRAALESLIDQKVTDINAHIATVRQEIEDDYNTKINTLKSDIETKYGDLPGRVASLESQNATQQEAIEAAQNEIDELWKQVNSQNELINQVYQALTDDLKEVKEQYASLSQDLNQLYQEIYGTGGLQEQMLQLNQALRDDMIAADEEIYLFIEQVREEASMYWRATEATFEELRQENEQLWQQLAQTNEILGQILNAHKADIEDLENKLADINLKYDNLVGRLNKLITGILLQATDNPVFGNFSLPIGVKNNVLFNWYGFNSGESFQFPNNGNEYAYNDQLAGVDFAALGAETETIQEGFLGEVNLGRVYLTVNPVGHNFDNTKFTLEKSNGEALPFGLKITPSDDELFFGYTRANNAFNNGFYAADVIIDGDQNALNKGINATKLTIDDNLKSAVKDVLKDRTKRNAVELLKAVYNQLADQLPAYAVRYDWTDADGNPYAVLSNYDLAIASAKPLSYNNLKFSIDHKLRTFGYIDNIIYNLLENENLKFDFTKYSIKFDKFEIKIDPLVINTNTVKVEGGSLTVTLPTIYVHSTIDNSLIGTATPDPVVVEGNDLKNIYTAIEKGIKDAIESMSGDITGWTKDLQNEVNTKIDNMLADVQIKINDMLQQIGDDITGRVDNIITDLGDKAQPWFDRLNKVVDLYNKVAGKINNVLEDPNHYLQVAMFYNQADSKFGMLSNSKKSPTPFKGGNGNVGLYASSYSAELVAPAYKKFVAVSNVYNADGSDMNAADAKALRDKANQGNFNKVMDGSTIRYSLPVSNLEKNKIYEIVYQGLDFHGVTSTQKFYITVK